MRLQYFSESMFDVGYSFVMDIGTIPLEFMGGLEEDPNFLVSAFLMEVMITVSILQCKQIFMSL